MRILLFSGSHSRHYFLLQGIVENFEVCGVVHMEREQLIPEPPLGIPEIDRTNFIRHFKERHEAELKYFGDVRAQDVFSGIPIHYCNLPTFNTEETCNFVRAQKPDLVFIFGAGLIKEPLMSVLPYDKVNVHLGFSPWYRGSATFFWPFYNMEPHWTATTFHQIVPEIDGGPVIHHTRTEFREGDGIHDIGARTVVDSRNDAIALLKLREQRAFVEVPQKTHGRLYLSKHFRPEHLRVIYNTFDNTMVDAYLRGELSRHEPKLVRAF
ncbi:MAG TPA: methionyl-tRNA formyltransferase [Candidatus Paceibacterota bacterium]|nr:methionyl-tRNA formyltransferase [Candidatus Paceibacterota bacterium]